MTAHKIELVIKFLKQYGYRDIRVNGKTLSIIWKSFYEIFRDELILKGKSIDTPLGTFKIMRFKPQCKFTKRYVDWAETKKENFIVRHMNEHTDGYACKFQLISKKSLRIKYFGTRTLDRYLAKMIKTHPNLYKQYEQISKYKRSNLSDRRSGSRNS